jgi:hypothetical protein
LLELLHRLEVIGDAHEELFVWDVRRAIGYALLSGFAKPTPGYTLPDKFAMLIPEGNRKVREVLEWFLSAAREAAESEGLLGFHARLQSVQNWEVRTARQNNYSNYFAWFDPNLFDDDGNTFDPAFLKPLHLGIAVPEHSVTVPWLISRRSLYRYIPRKHFCFLLGPNPLLNFTCLGIAGGFVFDFVSHPNLKLTGITLKVDDTPIATERAVPIQLLNHLGLPRSRDTHIFNWSDDKVGVCCSVAIERRQPDDAKVYSFSNLTIRYCADSR